MKPLLSFSSFPDEITVNCLARISKSYYPKLSTVSKSFKSLLISKELYAARTRLGNTEEYLYVCLWDYTRHIHQWFTLWINPDRTLTKKKETIAQLLVPIPSSNFPSMSTPTVVGSDVYVIGGPVHRKPSSIVRVLDCHSHTWRDAPSMNADRMYASTIVYGGKIYVIGGVQAGSSPFAEVFDTKTQTWKCLPDLPVSLGCCPFINISEVEGKIYAWRSKTNYVYDLNKGIWECCNGRIAMAPRSECVMDNVMYSCDTKNGRFMCSWYDIKDRKWKKVKGLDTFDEYMRNVDSTRTFLKLVSFGGNLLASWEERTMDPTLCYTTKIWCAELVVEKRDGGDIWGEIKWVNLVHTAPVTYRLLHCLAVSL